MDIFWGGDTIQPTTLLLPLGFIYLSLSVVRPTEPFWRELTAGRLPEASPDENALFTQTSHLTPRWHRVKHKEECKLCSPHENDCPSLCAGQAQDTPNLDLT